MARKLAAVGSSHRQHSIFAAVLAGWVGKVGVGAHGTELTGQQIPPPFPLTVLSLHGLVSPDLSR